MGTANILIQRGNCKKVGDMFTKCLWVSSLYLFIDLHGIDRFGFVVTCIAPDRQQSSDLFSTDRQYIHCTGNMFLLIPTRLQLQTGIQGRNTLNQLFKTATRVLTRIRENQEE